MANTHNASPQEESGSRNRATVIAVSTTRSVSRTPTSGGRNDLFVRGGASFENLFVVDNVEIPNINNFANFASAGGTVSVADLFTAGIIPGMLLTIALMITAYVVARKRGYPAEPFPGFGKLLIFFFAALPGLLLIAIIFGGVRSGVFTATESASIAVVWAFFVTMFIYRDYKWSDLPKLMHRTVKTVTIVMILIGFAAAFGYIMTLMMIPLRVTTFLTELSDNKYVILALINVLLIVLGTLMDMAPLILILTPILLPVVTSIGVDPVHFGMIMMVNLGMGLITPPVGGVLFVGSAIAKLPMETVVKALLPFYVALFGVLMAVTYLPAISLWLPQTVLAR